MTNDYQPCATVHCDSFGIFSRKDKKGRLVWYCSDCINNENKEVPGLKDLMKMAKIDSHLNWC